MAVNQYKRDGNSPNDYKKGNRTKGQPRNGDGLTAISKAVSEDIATYKEIAEKVRQSRKYKQEDVITVYNRLAEYIESQKEKQEKIWFRIVFSFCPFFLPRSRMIDFHSP